MTDAEQRDRALMLAMRRALLLVVHAIDARYEPQNAQEHAVGRS